MLRLLNESHAMSRVIWDVRNFNLGLCLLHRLWKLCPGKKQTENVTQDQVSQGSTLVHWISAV